MGDTRRYDLSLAIGCCDARDAKTGLREGEVLFVDKELEKDALTALRKHDLKKCCRLVEKSLMAEKKRKLKKKRVKQDFSVDIDSLRISDAFVVGPARVIYKLVAAS